MRLANSRFSGIGSTAMMVVAPAMRAPWMMDRPTPPQPTTATASPALIFTVFSAAPAPVVTPQPIRQVDSSAVSSGTLMADPAGMTMCEPNEARPHMAYTSSPSSVLWRVVPSM